MKTLIWGQQKGGSGKSTLAAHVGVAAEMTGTSTCFIDCDPQGSLGGWWKARATAGLEAPVLAAGTTAELPSKLKALEKAGIRLVVIDTPAAAGPEVGKLFTFADLVCIPVKASPHDLRAVGPTIDMVKAAGKPFRFVVNMVKPRSSLTALAAAALSEHGAVAPVFVGDRQDFVSPMSEGSTAMEWAPASKSAQEIRALWTWLRQQMR